MLIGPNVFMTFAWYGPLKFTDRSLWTVILVSWGIAFFEYCLAVPANRLGHAAWSTAELETMQEVITLTVFAGFSVFWLKEPLHGAWGALFGLAGSDIRYWAGWYAVSGARPTCSLAAPTAELFVDRASKLVIARFPRRPHHRLPRLAPDALWCRRDPSASGLAGRRRGHAIAAG